ncbi:MAG: hypothetical protein Q7S27_01725 [Nanoarchaeota archaeon]|nr:hypothetical protein [Nanoarchaeota archaeon]
MRRISFIVFILGLFALFFIFLYSQPLPISNPAQLSSLVSNQRIIIEGKVIKESLTANNKLLKLNNNFTLLCPRSCPPLLNKQISAQVKFESSSSRHYLKVLELSSN